MSDEDISPDDRLGKIENIRKALKDGSAPRRPTKPRKNKPLKVVSITGDSNIVGDGNVQNIFHGTPVEKKIVVVKTGDGVLTTQQKAKINELIKEWAGTRSAVRRSRSEIAALRSAFNKAMKVSSYHEILQEDFGKAVAWLRRQTGIVNSMASAPMRNLNWRTSRYRAINARAKEFVDGEKRYRRYVSDRFGTTSLKELNNDQLEVVYRYVLSWRL